MFIWRDTGVPCIIRVYNTMAFCHLITLFTTSYNNCWKQLLHIIAIIVVLLIWCFKNHNQDGNAGVKTLSLWRKWASFQNHYGRKENRVKAWIYINLGIMAMQAFKTCGSRWENKGKLFWLVWDLPNCNFDLHFSNTEQCWASFHVPAGHLYVSFEKCLLRSSATFCLV